MRCGSSMNEISRAAPLITLIAHQIVHLIGLFRVDSRGLEIEHQPSDCGL